MRGRLAQLLPRKRPIWRKGGEVIEWWENKKAFLSLNLRNACLKQIWLACNRDSVSARKSGQ